MLWEWTYTDTLSNISQSYNKTQIPVTEIPSIESSKTGKLINSD